MDVREFSKIIVAGVFLVLLQVLLLNNIQLMQYGFTPLFYVLFILILPFDIAGWLLLLLAFFLGFSIDIFEDTPGIHTSATVAMAFFRPFVARSMAPRDGYESGIQPRIFYLGAGWFITYASILVLIHHIVYFSVEVFSISHLPITLLRILVTTIFSLIFIIISQFFMFRK